MKILKLMLVVAVMLLVTPQVLAYTIDGNLSDWGLSKLYTDNWGINDTWLPNAGVRFVVEDNRDPNWSSVYTGVHIMGNGSTYEAYLEPKLVNVNDPTDTAIPPAGGEYYDLEAMYLAENDTMIFVAVVISSQSPWWGDLALDLDGDGIYEYGVKVRGVLYPNFGVTQVPIYETPTADCWKLAWNYVPENGPMIREINTSSPNVSVNGTATIAYVDSGIVDNGYTNYFVEIAIPKDAVGIAGKYLPDPPLPKRVYFPESCGNDSGGITIPEFPVLLIPLGAILGTIYFFRRRSK